MTKVRTFLAASSVAAMALAISAAPASAAVFINPFVGGPFSADNPLGTLPSTALKKGNTYDFTFQLVNPLSGPSATQAEAQILTTLGSTAEKIQYQVYEGDPTTAHPEQGTLLATSTFDFSPTVTGNWGPGDYYINILSSEITKSGEIASGSFVTTPAPEPATWGMMLFGLGLIGAGLRLGRRSGEAALPIA